MRPIAQGPALDLRLFVGALVPCLAVAVTGIGWPEALEAASRSLTGTAFRALDWFFLGTVSGLLVLATGLALSPIGREKLGKPEDEPEFGLLSWLSMLFSAGMGAGLLFWGAAEPIMHFAAPPEGLGGTPEAARLALVTTIFHWGFHAWAVYGIAALVLAWFGFRLGQPYLAGAPLRAAFTGRWVGPVAWLADWVAVMAIALGVAGSVGMGLKQILAGLAAVSGWETGGLGWSAGILALLVVSYMASASTSLDKGIQILSNINMGLAVAVLAFVFAVGPTSELLRATVETAGLYIAAVPSLSARMFAFGSQDGWLHGWTIIYFIWWIAWAPFVGIFIARISKGRTVREFVAGVLVAPTLFSLLWFCVFGGTALSQELQGGGVLALVQADVTTALFALFGTLPMGGALSVAAVILIFVFLVTSVDSATFVLGMLTSRGSLDPPRSTKLIWGLVLGAIGGALLLAGNIRAVQAVAISGAIPFSFILILQVGALLKVLLGRKA